MNLRKYILKMDVEDRMYIALCSPLVGYIIGSLLGMFTLNPWFSLMPGITTFLGVWVYYVKEPSPLTNSKGGKHD